MNKDDGMNASADRANRGTPGFMDAAKQTFSLFISRREPFNSFDVAQYVVNALNIPAPEKLQCLGRMFSLAHERGLIRPVSVLTSRSPSRNKGLQQQWIGCDPPAPCDTHRIN